VSALPNGTRETGNFSAPVYFNGYVYFCAVDDAIRAFQLSNGLLSTSPTSQSSAVYPNRGGAFAISANGSSNGILWVVQDNNPPTGFFEHMTLPISPASYTIALRRAPEMLWTSRQNSTFHW